MQNIDGIQKLKYRVAVKAPIRVAKKGIKIDAITRRQKVVAPKKTAVIYGQNFVVPFQGNNFKRKSVSVYYKVWEQVKLVSLFGGIQESLLNLKAQLYLKKRISVLAVVVALILAFSGGVWATLSTPQSAAETEVLTPAGTSAPINNSSGLGPISSVSNEALFNMTIGQLENYLNSIAENNKKMRAEEQMVLRKKLLKEYLKNKNSAFASASDTIAEQQHWKLILAISFAESTWGRNCVDNNCSNIGVKPGHPAWRKYNTLKAWAVDFNGLLERKYKDWTLEEMNGVYVQPKNPNWLLATRQVLQDLQEQGIE